MALLKDVIHELKSIQFLFETAPPEVERVRTVLEIQGQVLRVGGVDDVQQQVGGAGFLQGGAEGGAGLL